MEQKIAIVTGGNKGIGKAIAEKLRSDNTIVLSISRSGSESEFDYLGDVSKAEEMDAVIAAILEKYGKIDLLVNNAGITKDKLLLTMSAEDWREVMDVNLFSAFYLSKLVSRGMLKRRSGKIINISSVVGLHGNAGQCNYSASKAGLIGLTKSMAKEYAPKGICVNAIAPGFIETAMTGKLSAEMQKNIEAQIPLKRFGQPEDIAAAVSFLASDSANYITGQVLSVCGGMSI